MPGRAQSRFIWEMSTERAVSNGLLAGTAHQLCVRTSSKAFTSRTRTSPPSKSTCKNISTAAKPASHCTRLARKLQTSLAALGEIRFLCRRRLAHHHGHGTSCASRKSQRANINRPSHVDALRSRKNPKQHLRLKKNLLSCISSTAP